MCTGDEADVWYVILTEVIRDPNVSNRSVSMAEEEKRDFYI